MKKWVERGESKGDFFRNRASRNVGGQTLGIFYEDEKKKKNSRCFSFELHRVTLTSRGGVG